MHEIMHNTYEMGYRPGEWIEPGTGATLFRIPGSRTIAKASL